MNSDDSFDVDTSNDIFHEILGMESWFYEVNAADKPFLGIFALFETDVASCLEFCEKFSDGDFVDLSEFFVDGLENGIDVIYFLFFEVKELLKLFCFFRV